MPTFRVVLNIKEFGMITIKFSKTEVETLISVVIEEITRLDDEMKSTSLHTLRKERINSRGITLLEIENVLKIKMEDYNSLVGLSNSPN